MHSDREYLHYLSVVLCCVVLCFFFFFFVLKIPFGEERVSLGLFFHAPPRQHEDAKPAARVYIVGMVVDTNFAIQLVVVFSERSFSSYAVVGRSHPPPPLFDTWVNTHTADLHFPTRLALPCPRQFEPKKQSFVGVPQTFSVTFDENGFASKMTVSWGGRGSRCPFTTADPGGSAHKSPSNQPHPASC